VYPKCIRPSWRMASALHSAVVTYLMQRYEELVTLRVTDQERIKARL